MRFWNQILLKVDHLLVQDTEASFCESEALSSELRLSEGEVLLPKVKTELFFNFLSEILTGTLVLRRALLQRVRSP